MAQAHMAAAQVVPQTTQTYPRQTTIAQKGHEILIRYIIDYCDKRGFKDTSTNLRRESKLNEIQKPPVDSPDGLLYEWWTCFWEIYTARVHPEKSTNHLANDYAQKLPEIQKRLAHEQGQMGPGPTPRQANGPPRPYINGTGPPPQTAVNGHGPPFANAIPGMNGAPTTANMPGVSGANPTPLQNPSLSHLGPSRPGQQRPYQASGMPGLPPGAQFVHSAQPRMVPNTGPHPPNAPNTRPGPGQSGSPQMADSQMARASSSPQQSGGTSLTDIPPGQLHEYFQLINYPMPTDIHALPEDVKLRIRDLHEQKGRPKNTRGTKRPSPGGEESLPKGESPSERKKQRRSPQEPGAALPVTPSMTPAQPPIGARPPPSNISQPKGPLHPHPQVLHPLSHTLGAPPSLTPMNSDILRGPGLAGQMAQLVQVNQRQQSDQQYFATIQQQAFSGYKGSQPTNVAMPPGPASSQPLNPDSATPFGKPAVGATLPPRGAMLPPPPPNNPSIPSPGPGGQMPSAKGTPVLSGAVPRGLPGGKDDSSPGGIEGFSPENTRPASRPIPGSTPQAMSSAATPSASTAGLAGPQSGMSVPSPSQLATPQQSSRPQSQSPSATATARPSTATLNGTPTVGSTPNPNSILARAYPGAPSGPGSMLGNTPTNPTLTPSLLASQPTSLRGMESQSSDMFAMELGMPFSGLDMQMMNYQDDTFSFDLGLGLGGGDDTYNLYINDPGDSLTG